MFGIVIIQKNKNFKNKLLLSLRDAIKLVFKFISGTCLGTWGGGLGGHHFRTFSEKKVFQNQMGGGGLRLSISDSRITIKF